MKINNKIKIMKIKWRIQDSYINKDIMRVVSNRSRITFYNYKKETWENLSTGYVYIIYYFKNFKRL